MGLCIHLARTLRLREIKGLLSGRTEPRLKGQGPKWFSWRESFSPGLSPKSALSLVIFPASCTVYSEKSILPCFRTSQNVGPVLMHTALGVPGSWTAGLPMSDCSRRGICGLLGTLSSRDVLNVEVMDKYTEGKRRPHVKVYEISTLSLWILFEARQGW